MAGEIVGIMINLKKKEKQVLFLKKREKQVLFLATESDSSTSRMGVGNDSPNPLDEDMFIGKLPNTIFNEVRAKVTPDIVQNMGKHFTAPVIKGETCLLSVLVKYNTGEENAIEFEYGEDSIGPSPSVSNLVLAAVRGTDSWHRQQKEMVRRRSKKR